MVTPGGTDYEPTNRAILNKLEGVEKTLETYVKEHGGDHALIDRRFAAYDTANAVREFRERGFELTAVDVAILKKFQVQVETIGTMTRWILGGSFIAALAAVASLIVSVTHAAGS
jgi:hypothetical protein